MCCHTVFSPDQEFINASGVRLLSQEHDGNAHPIGNASCFLDPHEKNYRITEVKTVGCHIIF